MKTSWSFCSTSNLRSNYRLFSFSGHYHRSKFDIQDKFRFTGDDPLVASRCFSFNPGENTFTLGYGSKCAGRESAGFSAIVMPRSLHDGISPLHTFKGIQI